MPIQRACDAEKQAGNKTSNGPRRAQGKIDDNESSILRRKACVSCRGYQRYPAECVIVHKFKVAPRIKIIRP
ncbi:MAG: hypothetical protein IIX48_07230 [Lachnospiraceae bacterium]|nr:hypothetical protein [Lachnospiraceae bacterium]